VFGVRRKSIRGGLIALASVLCLAVPARAALFGDDIARKGVADQTKRLDDYRLEVKSQTDVLAARLSKMEESLRGTQSTQQSMLELVNQIELLKREIQSLRGQIEVVNNGVEANAKRQRDMYVDLDTRLRRLEQGPPAGAAAPDAAVAPAAAAPPAVAPPAAAAGAASADETRIYEAAQQQRRIGNYKGAITSFQSFLGQYPKSPLAHRAQYWIGDCYFNLRDYKNAIASQQKLMAAYPDSASAPDAMLNIASAQSELGESAGARKTMDTLVARYPGSEAADKAKRRLATLR
jgi:tol-pal system protein YbgF